MSHTHLRPLVSLLLLLATLLVATPARAMTVHASSSTGWTLTLDVEPGTVGATVKQMIASARNIPVTGQRLIFKGASIADNKPIGDYGVTAGATIRVLIVATGPRPPSAGPSPAPEPAPDPAPPTPPDTRAEAAFAAHILLAARSDTIFAHLSDLGPARQDGPTLSSSGKADGPRVWMAISASPDPAGPQVSLTLGAETDAGGAILGAFASYDRTAFDSAAGHFTATSPGLGLYAALPLPGALRLNAMIGATREKLGLSGAERHGTRQFAALGLVGQWEHGPLTLSPDIRLAAQHGQDSRSLSLSAHLRATASPRAFALAPFAELAFDRSAEWSPGNRHLDSALSAELGFNAALGGGSVTLSAQAGPAGPRLTAGYGLSF